ncbi:MAG: ribonuclease domain-containing protein [Pseudoxanthomonas sp.]
MRKLSPIVIVLVLLLLAGGWWLQKPAQPDFASAGLPASSSTAASASAAATAAPGKLPGFLPREARQTLALIANGGPFPHPQDDGVFGNREGHLPKQPRGYYREYTVETPGLSHRGARRIITGGNPPAVYYYTSDHYDSFRSFRLSP